MDLVDKTLSILYWTLQLHIIPVDTLKNSKESHEKVFIHLLKNQTKYPLTNVVIKESVIF